MADEVIGWGWKNNPRLVSPCDVAEELEMIGSSVPMRIIRYALKHKNSALYKCFNWEDDDLEEQAIEIMINLRMHTPVPKSEQER